MCKDCWFEKGWALASGNRWHWLVNGSLAITIPFYVSCLVWTTETFKATEIDTFILIIDTVERDATFPVWDRGKKMGGYFPRFSSPIKSWASVSFRTTWPWPESRRSFGLESDYGASDTHEREMDKTKKPEKSAMDRSRTSKNRKSLVWRETSR